MLSSVPTPASAGLNNAAIDLEQLNVNVQSPTAMAVRPASTGDDDLYFAERGGDVVRWNRTDAEPAVILDISGRVTAGGEQGLLGITFSPDGTELFVNYTDDTGGDTVVRGYPYTGAVIDDPDGYDILEITQPFDNHNGGNLAFGPDGYLYIGMGDGGSQDDPGNRAQSLDSLLGKMLRIDPVDGGGYEIPPDNPWADPEDGKRDEIWARGFRNPWRFSFDSQSGNLWIGDVGGARREEIDKQPADSNGGENYGWRRMEGSLRNVGKVLPARKHAEPYSEYTHRNGNCAITGGYVYRGSAIPDLEGAYLYGDFCVGKLKAISSTDRTNRRGLGETVNQLASFGEDADGELYVLSLGGNVSKIVPGP